MAESVSLPTIVIVGRPNVGKSTLFNVLTGTRRSIVGDEPGITRDRIHGEAVHRGRHFELIDTGGIIPDDQALIPSQILKQAKVALEKAMHILFLIDGRTEITGVDRDLARMLKKTGKPVSLVVNKIDTPKSDPLVNEFYGLGIQDVFGVSAEHRVGIEELLEHITTGMYTEPEPEKGVKIEKPKHIKIAIIGRPNVGKSTLLNSLVGEDRAIVSPIAGTTRDAVDETVVQDGVEFIFVDTAGIRRKGRTHEMAEKLSVVMARRHIRMAHVVLLVVDATEGMVGSDATVAGYAHEEGRALIICVNKWDAAPDKDKKKFTQEVRDSMKFLEYAQVAFLSAKTGIGVKNLYAMVLSAYTEASKRIGTGALNRFAATLNFEPEVKVKYMTQASIRPPMFIIFTDKKKEMHFSLERNLMNRLRKEFGFEGTPIVVKTKTPERRKGR
jgi:GTP-binding protein